MKTILNQSVRFIFFACLAPIHPCFKALILSTKHDQEVVLKVCWLLFMSTEKMQAKRAGPKAKLDIVDKSKRQANGKGS